MLSTSKFTRAAFPALTLGLAMAGALTLSACQPGGGNPPTLTAVAPGSGPAAGGTPIKITGTFLAQDGMVTVGDVPCAPVVFVSDTEIHCTTGAHAAGSTDIVYLAADGQDATLPKSFVYAAPPGSNPPKLKTVSPGAGPDAGGTPITITGTFLAPNGTVTIGGAPCAPVAFVSDTRIQCTTGAHAAGIFDLVYQGADGQAATLAHAFTFVAPLPPNPPTLTAVAPAIGPASGGTLITLTGTFLAPNATVSVGGIACAPVVFVSDTQIHCTTGAHAAGSTDIVYQGADGQSATLAQGFSFSCADPGNVAIIAWANDGGDKVTRDEARAGCNQNAVKNSVWDGTTIRVFGARNEVVDFNVILEALGHTATGVTVAFDTLTGPSTITSVPASGNGVFDWTQRPIELFYVRYLPIKGLSVVSYDTYDERHIPRRLQRPWTDDGIGSGGWANRPDHDKFYPDIAVPMEVVPSFNIAQGQNQSVWADIYIPKTAAAGVYTGTFTIREGAVTQQIPVELTVRGFSLPDVPSSRTMVNLGYSDLGIRYTGTAFPDPGTPEETKLKAVRDRHFQLAHRHKISLVDSDEGADAWSQDQPRPVWIPRLTGELFTSAHGYDGPGAGTGNRVYSIGHYGSWDWKSGTEADMWTHTNAWESWMAANAPTTDHFLYLIDESDNFAQTEQWARWIHENPGVGRGIRSMATIDLLDALASVPDLDIVASTIAVGDTAPWTTGYHTLQAAGKKLQMYNGHRPAEGSFATEDDGVALRELAWGQYKLGIDRWFFWESTYYTDTQSGRGNNDLFHSALTFGADTGFDTEIGRSGFNYSNGDGVLFYPGTDRVFAADSYGLSGPIASLRLKHWRRGIQDIDYLNLARAINPAQVQLLVSQMVPKAIWEYGVADPASPTYVRSDISWSIHPDDWEAARAALANIIEGH